MAKIAPVADNEPGVVGTVTVKYLISPSPIDLNTVSGMKMFGTRIFNYLRP